MNLSSGRGLAAVLLFAALTTLTACREQPAAAVTGPGWRMVLTVSPPTPAALRPAVLRVTVSGRPAPGDPTTVTGEVAMPAMDHRAAPLAFTRVGEGHYEARHTFSMGGTWAVRVTVTGRSKTLTGSFTVRVAD